MTTLVEELAAALRTSHCPYPIGSDVRVEQCIAAGKCGCDNKTALARHRAQSSEPAGCGDAWIEYSQKSGLLGKGHWDIDGQDCQEAFDAGFAAGRQSSEPAMSEAGWRPMSEAPRDGTAILAARDNGCSWDYYVVWWGPHIDQETGYQYDWCSDNNAFPHYRMDVWMPLQAPSAPHGE